MVLARIAATRARSLFSVAAMCGLLFAVSPASAQPYGRPVAQPFFDFDNAARFVTCRPGPYAWTFDPYAQAAGCDDNCRQGFTAHRPPSWYVIADFAPMTYDPNADVILARTGPDGDVRLSTSNLDPEFDSGARITIGRTFGGCYQVEGSYLGVYSWFDQATVFDTAGDLSTIFSNFADPEIAGLDNNNLATVSDYNSFKSAEINVRAWLNVPPGPFDVQILLGARYMKAFEDFRFSAEDIGGATNSAIVQTRNDLYGVQLGIDTKWLLHSHFFIDFELKGGILQDFASQNTQYTVTNGGVSVFNTEAHASRTAWFGDLILTANWQLAPNWSVRAGYQAIFVNGLALGPNNFQTDNTLLQTGPGELEDSGEVVYHGPVLGLMWTR